MAGKGDAIKKLLSNLPGSSPGKAKGKEGAASGKTDKLLKAMMEKIGGGTGGKGGMPGGGQGGGDRKQFRKTVNAVVTEFSKNALRQLGIGKKEEKAEPGKEPMPKKAPSWWRKLLGPALLILGGLAAFVYGLLTDGPLKGLMKLLAKGGIMGGLKWLGKIIGKQIKHIKHLFKAFVKKLPKGFLKLISKVKRMVLKIFNPVLRIFTKVIPNFFKKMFSPLTKIFKVGGKGILGKIVGMVAKIGGKLLKTIKFIPFIGSLISFAFAYSRFKKGDIAGGLLEVLSGIAGLFPGIGTAISIGIDILLAVLDVKSGGSGPDSKPKGGILLDWGKKIFGFVMKLPPFSNIIHLWKGFKSVFKGQWKKAAEHFMFSIPLIGNVLELFMSPGKDPDKEPSAGSKDGFFAGIYNWMIGHFPIKNLLQMWGGIKNIFKGDIFKGFLDIAYAIPFFGSIVKFFGGPETSEKAEEGGSRGGLWGIVKDYINNLFPISNVIHIWKGLKAVFRMDWATAAEHFMFAVPLVGNVLGFFAGSGEPTKGKQEKAPSIFERIKQGVMNKFKPIWKAMPRFMRWIARKILPDSILTQLDNPGPEHHDKIDMVHSGSPEKDPPPVNPYAAALKSVIDKFKPIWKAMPGFARWIARKVLPSAVIKLIDNPTSDETDVQTAGSAPAQPAPIDPYAAALKSVIDKFKPIWKAMPGFARWIARKVLPPEVIKLIDNPTSDETDTPTQGSAPPAYKKPNPFRAINRALLDKFRPLWKGMPKWMKWIAKKILPSALVKQLESGESDDLDTQQAQASTGSMDAASRGMDKATKLAITAAKRLISATKIFATVMYKIITVPAKALISAGKKILTPINMIGKWMTFIGKKAYSAGQSLWKATQLLLKGLLFALKPGMGFVKSLTGLVRQQRPKMPIAEKWQRRPTPETQIKAGPDQTPIPVRVIEPIQLKKPSTAEGDPMLEVATNSAHLAVLPSLLKEFQLSEIDGRSTILGTLQAIAQNTKTGMGGPLFLPGNPAVQGTSGPNRQRGYNT